MQRDLEVKLERVEVVFDLPVEAFGDAHTVAGDLDAEVLRLRHTLVTKDEWAGGRHGSATEALDLLTPHQTGPEGVVVSALLVCTHRRFTRCSRTLMRKLAASDVLDDDQLDELATMLLWEDQARFAAPSTWVSTWLEVPPGTRVRASGHALVAPEPEEQTFPHTHAIPAAARRWATRRLLETGHTDIGAVLVRSGQLEGGTGGAVLCGALDAWETCPPGELQAAIDTALASSLASVRLRALDVLARIDRADEAMARARDDGAAQVRRWQPPADARARTPDQPTLL